MPNSKNAGGVFGESDCAQPELARLLLPQSSYQLSRGETTEKTSMSAHHTLATKLGARKDTDGQYFDVGGYAFVSEPGPGRVHVADLNYAMDSGASSLSFKRGFVSYERFPPIQIMTYGQWFAYIHAIWDEWYRPRLAAAYSRQLGEEFVKNDVKSAFMGELNKIRNDVIHNKSHVKESARNSILDWGASDGLVGMTTEKMMSLRTSFPRDELLTPPVHGDAPNTQNIPWTADIQLIDSVKQRLTDLGVTKRQQKGIGDEMLRLWLEANSMSTTAEIESGYPRSRTSLRSQRRTAPGWKALSCRYAAKIDRPPRHAEILSK